MNAAETPFDFVTVSYLTRIGNQSAGTLAELLTGIENCSDASIFHHAYQTLGSHPFLTEGSSTDSAPWVLADPTRTAPAEQLAALDIRDYASIAALRSDRSIVADVERGQLLREVVAVGVREHPLREIVGKTLGEKVMAPESLIRVMEDGGVAAILDPRQQLVECPGRLVADSLEMGNGN